jgi:hypothetical protein
MIESLKKQSFRFRTGTTELNRENHIQFGGTKGVEFKFSWEGV